MTRPRLRLLEGYLGAIEVQLDGKYLRNVVLDGTTLIYDGGECMIENLRNKGGFKLITNSPSAAFDDLKATMQRKFGEGEEIYIPPKESAAIKVHPNSVYDEPLKIELNGQTTFKGFDVFLDAGSPVDLKMNGAVIRGPRKK